MCSSNVLGVNECLLILLSLSSPSQLPPRPIHNSFIFGKIVASFLWILITLTTRSQAFGRPFAWSEPVIELPWFNQVPGWPEDAGPHPGHYAYPAGYAGGGVQQMMGGGYVVQQNPGHSVVIRPGVNGQAPTVTQVPGVVTSA